MITTMQRPCPLFICAAWAAVMFIILLSVQDSIGSEPDPNPQQGSFKMLVIGDSIVWGQGLMNHQKFSHLIENDIESLLGRKVDVVNRSHSGATILPRYNSSLTEHGEVPIPSPTLWEQFHSSIPEYKCVERGVEKKGGRKKYVCAEVDLILVNGCINDVALERILNPFVSRKKITRLSRQFCFEEMTRLLAELTTTFVNATIVVTGYYPIVSSGEGGTPRNLVVELLRAFLTRKKVRDAVKGSRAGPRGWIVDKLSKLSTAWSVSSDRDLLDSINKTNAAAGKVRAHFIDIDFAASESYAAAHTRLWMIEEFNEDRKPLTNDHLLKQRMDTLCPPAKKHLNEIKMKSSFRFLLKSICIPAGAGHPNAEGALKYREAIWKTLRPVLTQN